MKENCSGWRIRIWELLINKISHILFDYNKLQIKDKYNEKI